MPWWSQSKIRSGRRTKKKEMGEKRKSDERHKERKNQRSGVDVLFCMVVTAAVFHLERSALNTDAPENTVEVLSMPWWSQSKIKVEEERRKKKTGEKTEVDERHKERKNQRSGVDVLLRMVVTAAVFHLEMSALNADASLNTVEVNAMVVPIQNKSRKRTKKWL